MYQNLKNKCRPRFLVLVVIFFCDFYFFHYRKKSSHIICISLPKGKIPWRRKWQPTPIFLPGKSHGLRSLVGYSPGGRKESDTTEQCHFHLRVEWHFPNWPPCCKHLFNRSICVKCCNFLFVFGKQSFFFFTCIDPWIELLSADVLNIIILLWTRHCSKHPQR